LEENGRLPCASGASSKSIAAESILARETSRENAHRAVRPEARLRVFPTSGEPCDLRLTGPEGKSIKCVSVGLSEVICNTIDNYNINRTFGSHDFHQYNCETRAVILLAQLTLK
jgi:hypothetical protein